MKARPTAARGPSAEQDGDGTLTVTLTERAAREIRRTLDDNGIGADTYLRIVAVGAGCCEYTYGMDLADAPSDDDTVLESHGVRLVFDPQSFENMQGTEVDFSDDPANRGYIFHNPNARGKHACDEPSPE